MRDVIPDINQWLLENKRVALATVVQTWGSAPRKIGAHMAISEESEIAGSVSGGCVESAVAAEALEVIKSGNPSLLQFGVADDTAWEVGLACGGEIEVFVHPLNPGVYLEIEQRIRKEKPVAFSTIIKGPRNGLGKTEILKGKIENQNPHRVEAEISGQAAEAFINIVLPSPTLIIIGGVQIGMALSRIAKIMDYRTVLIEPRRAFSDKNRFPDVDHLLETWPENAFEEIQINETTAIATLTIDPKIDDPALSTALNSKAFYVGALGSQKTQMSRKKRLIEAGFDEDQISRIRGPIGLKIGAQSPEEIAIAIMAEIVATRRGNNQALQDHIRKQS